jgi:hypothetical protein
MSRRPLAYRFDMWGHHVDTTSEFQAKTKDSNLSTLEKPLKIIFTAGKFVRLRSFLDSSATVIVPQKRSIIHFV